MFEYKNIPSYLLKQNHINDSFLLNSHGQKRMSVMYDD